MRKTTKIFLCTHFFLFSHSISSSFICSDDFDSKKFFSFVLRFVFDMSTTLKSTKLHPIRTGSNFFFADVCLTSNISSRLFILVSRDKMNGLDKTDSSDLSNNHNFLCPNEICLNSIGLFARLNDQSILDVPFSRLYEMR